MAQMICRVYFSMNMSYPGSCFHGTVSHYGPKNYFNGETCNIFLSQYPGYFHFYNCSFANCDVLPLKPFLHVGRIAGVKVRDVTSLYHSQFNWICHSI